MSLTNLYKSMEGNKIETIKDAQGGATYVYEILPCDLEQKTPEQFANWFNELKIYLNQLPADEKSQDFYKFYYLNDKIILNTTKLHPSIAGCEVKPSENFFSDLIGAEDFYSDVQVHEDYLHFNSIYFRLINLYEMPKTLFPCELQNYGDYVVFCKKANPSVAKRRINAQRKLHHSNLHTTMRNLESEASYREAELMVEELMVGEESIFEVESWLLLKAESLKELNEKTTKIIGELKQREIKPLIEAEGLGELFPCLLFGIKPSFKRSHDCPSSYLANLLPMNRDFLMEKGYGFNSLRGSEVYYSTFNENALNYNILISGMTGTGKSVIAQKIVKEEVSRGAKAIILDLGHSFRKTALYFNSNVFSKKFNPLQFRNPQYLKELIVSVIPEKELTSKMEGKIFELISKHHEEVKTFKELVLLLDAEIPELALYFSELWDYFTDEITPISDITYVDTTVYPSKIISPLIIYLIEYFKHLEGHRLFVFDECWHFLKRNATYVAECFRTFRKHSASAVAISQSLDDFLSTDLGKVIAHNCYYKILFYQNSKGEEFLNDFDRDNVQNLQTKKGIYSSFYFKTEHSRKTLRFYADPLEYELFTSSQEDNLKFQKFSVIYDDFFQFSEVMDRWVDFKYFHGGVHA